MTTASSLDPSQDEFDRIEADFRAALDESLHPRGPDLLYDLAGQLGLPPQAHVLDQGCGAGRHAIALAERFGFAVQGIDSSPRKLELALATLRDAATRMPELSGRVRFQLGVAEFLPIRDASVDLIWCREMICVVAALDAVFAECRRVLRPGGRMLIYCNFVTDPQGLSGSWYRSLGMVPASAEASNVEAAALRQGFLIDQSLALGSETGEYAQETTGEPGRRLLHAARLLRDPDRYIARFGRANYDIMLGDCFWHVYRMIGKLGLRIYLLTRA